MAIWRMKKGIFCDPPRKVRQTDGTEKTVEPRTKPFELVDMADKKHGCIERVPHTYYPGDLIETDQDMTFMNRVEGLDRIEKVRDSLPGDELDHMTVKELRDLANRESIDLPETGMSRVKIIKAIRARREYTAALV